MNKKQLLLFLFPIIILSSAFASQDTLFWIQGELFNSSTMTPESNIQMAVDIFTTATCSGTPYWTGTFPSATDVNGVYSLLISNISMNFNQNYYACVYANSFLINGAIQFRAGQGQISDEDVDFTNLTADYFFGDGSGLTNITADDLDIDDNEWLYLDTADSRGIRWNSSGNNIEMNQRLYVPNMISANSIDAELGYFNYLQMGYKGFSTGYPFSVINSTGTIKFIIDNTGDMEFTDDNDNNYITWNESGIGVWKYSPTKHALEMWAGYDTEDYIALYNPTEIWGNLTMISGNVTADYFVGDGSLLTNLPSSPQYWNRSGTTIFQANYGDDVTLQNGSLYFDKDYYIDWLGQRLTFNSTSDRFEFNGSVYANGNVTADYFVGDGSQLTNIPTGVTDHDLLNNLNWSVAGHIMDDDVVFDTGKGFYLDNGMSNGLIYNLTAGGEMQWFGGEIHFMQTHLHLDDNFQITFGDDNDFGIMYDAGNNITEWYDNNGKPAWFITNIAMGDNETSADGILYMDGHNMGKWLRYNFTSTNFEFNDNVSAPYFIGNGSQLTNLNINATAINHSSLNNLNWSVAGHIMNTHLVPNIDNAYDIGNSTLRWRNANFSGNVTVNGTVSATNFTTNATIQRSTFEPNFLTTSGTATATISLDTVTRRIYNRFTQVGGGSQAGTGLQRCNACQDMVSLQTTPIRIYHRTNDITTGFSITVYINGIADGTLNGFAFSNSLANTWQQATFTPSSTITPNDKINIEITWTGNSAGDTGDLADLEVYYNAKIF